MPRAWVLLQLAEHRPAEHVREEDIQRDRGRTVLPSQSERVGPAGRNQHLEPAIVSEVDQDAAVVGVVLHDQKNQVIRLEILPVIRDLLR